MVRERELSGGEADTTNNRMELMAAISALEALGRPTQITVVTDSNYVKGGVTGWIHGWKRNGWKTSAKKPVKNVELWQRLDAAQSRHEVTWEWVKGHAGHPENERAENWPAPEWRRSRADLLNALHPRTARAFEIIVLARQLADPGLPDRNTRDLELSSSRHVTPAPPQDR